MKVKYEDRLKQKLLAITPDTLRGWRGYRQKLSVGKIRRFSGHRTQPCLEI